MRSKTTYLSGVAALVVGFLLGLMSVVAAEQPKVSAEAIANDYYDRLARDGSADAQLVLGDRYREGSDHVARDLVQAYVWYSVAAHQGVEEAISPMVEVLVQMSEAEQQRAKVLAEEYVARYGN